MHKEISSVAHVSRKIQRLQFELARLDLAKKGFVKLQREAALKAFPEEQIRVESYACRMLREAGFSKPQRTRLLREAGLSEWSR